MKHTKIFMAALIIGVTLSTTGCAGLNERNDDIRAGWEREGVTKQMDANWHYFDKKDPYADSMSASGN
jgi:hypothetical protein